MSVREGKSRPVRADYTVAVMGNPNVGKSTVFNALTGLNRHTGNWTGKTVDLAYGLMKHRGKRFALCDLPGCYSFDAVSPEEELARDFILQNKPDCVLIVCDASCLERNLNIILQTVDISDKVLVCVNLIDEAKKRGIEVDTELLSELLHVEVVKTSAKNGVGLDELRDATARTAMRKGRGLTPPDELSPKWEKAEELAKRVVTRDTDARSARELKLDRFLTGRVTGPLSMLLLLGLVLFITMLGANWPSALLSRIFAQLLERIRGLCVRMNVSSVLSELVVEGGLSTLLTVVSVMLPPMAIFFPLFTLLEDLGLLPRAAFDLDRTFARCGACGKTALTTCMGFGCNAAGISGCRIIDSPRERLIGILTNSFVPCNGRFPTLAALIAVFFTAGGGLSGSALGAAMMTGLILLGLGAVLLMSLLLSKTLLRGSPSSFVLELPPFRKPRVGRVLLRSLLDRTLFVLGRAASFAFPAGIVIRLLGMLGVTEIIVAFLEPFGRLLGVDGTVLTAFVLGLPANELVTPMMLSMYGGGGIGELAAHGWTAFTAFQVMLLVLFHSPCATTLLTIRSETRSVKWTLLAFLLPTAFGILLCLLTNGIRTVLYGL